jgi:hypothetical protein
MTTTATAGFASTVQDVYRAAYQSGSGSACRQLLAMRDRLGSPARIPVVGERSRGKSSLINALLRRPDLLPVDVDVTSNVFVVVARAEDEQSERVEVRFSDGTPTRQVPLAELVDYAGEIGNPGNERAVESVVVHLAHPLVARGIELVDTPGVGGLVTEHGSMAFEAARQADGLVMVLEAAKPISQAEIQFIQLLSAGGGGVRVVFCLTKADLYQGEDIREMTRFLDEALARHAPGLAGSPSVCVSASRLWRGLREDEPEARRRLIESSGMPDLLRAISGHVLAGVEADRVEAVLHECRRITQDLARPHRERLEVLQSGEDPAHRVQQLRHELAGLGDPARVRAEVSTRVRQLRDGAERDLRNRLQAMNNGLEDKINYHWKRTMRRTLPAEYDSRFRTTWLRVVNDFNVSVGAMARRQAEELDVTAPELDVHREDIKTGGRSGIRVRGWARIAWMSLISLGVMFPFQYMEHREAMRNADKADALRWLRRCIQLQGGCRDALRDHAASTESRLLQALESPLVDRRRSLEASIATLEAVESRAGLAETEQRLHELEQLSHRVDSLLPPDDGS